jgi:xanthine/uracil permease
VDAKVDFCRQKNLIVAGSSIIVATGLGIKGFSVGGLNIAGIAFGTVLALALNWIMSFGEPAGEAVCTPSEHAVGVEEAAAG